MSADDTPRDLNDALLGLALAMCKQTSARADDPSLSADQRRDALCEGFTYLLIASLHGLQVRDEEENPDQEGRP